MRVSDTILAKIVLFYIVLCPTIILFLHKKNPPTDKNLSGSGESALPMPLDTFAGRTPTLPAILPTAKVVILVESAALILVNLSYFIFLGRCNTKCA